MQFVNNNLFLYIYYHNNNKNAKNLFDLSWTNQTATWNESKFRTDKTKVESDLDYQTQKATVVGMMMVNESIKTSLSQCEKGPQVYTLSVLIFFFIVETHWRFLSQLWLSTHSWHSDTLLPHSAPASLNHEGRERAHLRNTTHLSHQPPKHWPLELTAPPPLRPGRHTAKHTSPPPPVSRRGNRPQPSAPPAYVPPWT